MSKRFGRNQKRAMRARIAELEQSNQVTSGLLASARTDRDFLKMVVERTAQVLGDHFVTLPVQTAEVKDMLDRFKVSIFQPHRMSYQNPNPNARLDIAVDDALNYIDMDTHQASVRTDELRRMIHMRYRSISGDVAYSLSDPAFRKLSEAHLVDLLKNQIAPEMAKHLIRERKKLYL